MLSPVDATLTYYTKEGSEALGELNLLSAKSVFVRRTASGVILANCER